MCICGVQHSCMTVDFLVLFLIFQITFKPTSQMVHTTHIYHKSLSLLLYCFMDEWQFIGFRMHQSFTKCLHFLFLKVNMFCADIISCVILFLTFHPIYNLPLCIFLLKQPKNILEENSYKHLKQLFIFLCKICGEEKQANEESLKEVDYLNLNVFLLSVQHLLYYLAVYLFLLGSLWFLFSKWH